jgi:hypothetical protein
MCIQNLIHVAQVKENVAGAKTKQKILPTRTERLFVNHFQSLQNSGIKSRFAKRLTKTYLDNYSPFVALTWRLNPINIRGPGTFTSIVTKGPSESFDMRGRLRHGC